MICLHNSTETLGQNILGPAALDTSEVLLERANPTLSEDVNRHISELLDDPSVQSALGEFWLHPEDPSLGHILAHQVRVAKKSGAMAIALGLFSEPEVKDIIMGGLLHDCYKQEHAIRQIVNSQAKPTEEESAVLQLHPVGGERRILKHTGNDAAAGIGLIHHTFQPNAYPVIGNEMLETYERILMLDRMLRPMGNIVSIADKVDATSAERPESPRRLMLDTYADVHNLHVGNTYPLDVLFAEGYGFSAIMLKNLASTALSEKVPA